MRTRLIAVAVWVFLLFWLAGMAAGLSAGRCRKPGFDPIRKERFCTVSIMAGAPIRAISAIDRKKSAILYLERGIARASLDRVEDARADIARALALASQGRGFDLTGNGAHLSFWQKALFARIGHEEEGSTARTIFEDVLNL